MEAAAHVLQDRDVAFGIVAELERPQVGSSKPGQWAHGLYGQVRKNAKLQRSMGALNQLIVHRGLMGSPVVLVDAHCVALLRLGWLLVRRGWCATRLGEGCENAQKVKSGPSILLCMILFA